MSRTSRRTHWRKPDILDRAIGIWKASNYDATNDRLYDVTGHGHHAQLGSTVGADTNDPTYLAWAGEQYLYLPGVSGNYADTPSSANLDALTDAEWRFDLSSDDWAYATGQVLAYRYETTGDHRAYILRTIAGEKKLQLTVGKSDGTFRGDFNTGVHTFADGERKQLKITYDADNGAAGSTVVFSYRDAIEDLDADTVAWTVLTSPTLATAQGFKSVTAGLYLGASSAGATAWLGKYYRSIIKDGIDGTVAFDADFTTQPAEPFATFTEGSSNAATVTINRSATGLKSAAVDRPMFLLGTDDYFEVADHADLDFAETESLTVVYAGRSYDTTAAQVFVAKKDNLTTSAGWYLGSLATAPAEIRVGDATNQAGASTGDLTDGVAFVVGGVVNIIDDDVTGLLDGVAGTPTTDNMAATLANAFALRIGATSNVAASFLDGEFFATALFREALTDEEVRQVGLELVGIG